MATLVAPSNPNFRNAMNFRNADGVFEHNKRSTKELLFLSTQGSGHFSISAPSIFVWGIPCKIKSKTESCCESSQQRYQSTFCTIDCRHHAELQIRMLIWVQDGEQSGSEPWVLQRCGVSNPGTQQAIDKGACSQAPKALFNAVWSSVLPPWSG